ncbi:atp-dependent protease la [Leptolyngbya sp. Heron Island J]|uniref:endopeptidase La n=1 Tax=Leptolyngbya sp. Heron Island J TaxID=1385935 RepID=UPI0003B9DD0E|nr:endopeptidase La [Leptolyngbya sp. Heron Island J]ESA33883.1 atp-dependent protease la [Leptolyngbya sp. Heron Island J]
MTMLWLPHSAKKIAQLESGFLLPVRDTVLLPAITLPLVAGRPHSITSVETAVATENKQLVIAAMRPECLKRLAKTRDAEAEAKNLSDLYSVATLGAVRRMARLPIGPIQLLVEGLERIQLEKLCVTDQGFEVEFRRLPALTVEAAVAAGGEAATINALNDAIKSLWEETAAVNPNFPDELLAVLINNDDAAQIAYQSVILMQQDVLQIQAALAENHLETLLRQVLGDLQKYVEEQRLRSQILGETKKEIDEQQREFFLRQQLKKIQEELGQGSPDQEEIADLRQTLEATTLPEVAEKQVKRELARLERIGISSAEGGVIRTYLDWLLEMPWQKIVEDNLDLQNANTVLDADHYGLKKVKERIIEHLATFKLKRQQQPSDTDESIQVQAERYAIGTVVCFVGPPGVGKTSLGRSIARALGRPFERISLGGLRDEAELRGHRRTYIGAMPGRIIQAIHRAGVKNPVIMLDELDKVGMDYRGDPASVLLEILDPQQNYCFHDLYLDVDFDLSQVIFIGTANDLSKVPPPLLDRLELVELSGYADRDKLAIAQTYLLPRQLEKAGLPKDAIILPEVTLRLVIDHYTREAGVRHLEQQLGSLCRKIAVKYAAGETISVHIHPEQLETWLGPPRYLRDERRQRPQPGVATGLAWTLAGGDVLFVEAVLLPQGKELTLTGQLGDVMEESVRIARSYIWSHAEDLGIDLALLKDNGVHLHVPAGAIPKDGPSAGVTMLTAMASLLLHQSVRTDTAMTGEIDLSGDVLPVGGIREKVLAAHRAGIRRVLLPLQNEKDLVDVPDHVRQEMEFVKCDRIEQILDNALVSAAQKCEDTNHRQQSTLKSELLL